MAIYSIVLLMMGEIVTRNMYSKAIAIKKTQLLHLVGLISPVLSTEVYKLDSAIKIK